MAEKVTRMSIKVDLQCSRCRKKIKKILCKFPQIRDQMYDEKQNLVSITVICCSPEKIRRMIICKGGETVQGVEILPDKKPDKPNKPEKPKKPENPENPENPDKPDPAPPEPPQQAVSPPPKTPNPVAGYPPVPVYPTVPVYPMVGVCCCPPGYGWYGGGPCYCGRRRSVMCSDGCGRPADQCQRGNGGPYHGQGRPMLCDDGCGRPAGACRGGSRGFYPGPGRPVMCDDGCGRLACECRGWNTGYCVSRCDYFNEENATGCTVM